MAARSPDQSSREKYPYFCNDNFLVDAQVLLTAPVTVTTHDDIHSPCTTEGLESLHCVAFKIQDLDSPKIWIVRHLVVDSGKYASYLSQTQFNCRNESLPSLLVSQYPHFGGENRPKCFQAKAHTFNLSCYHSKSNQILHNNKVHQVPLVSQHKICPKIQDDRQMPS